MSDNAVADVLMKAHDELLLHGWCQEFIETDGGEHCALGAISSVLGLRGEDWGLLYPDYTDVGLDCMLTLFDAIREQNQEVSVGFKSGRRCVGVLSVTHWNDAEGRTLDDVLDAFRLAAKKARG